MSFAVDTNVLVRAVMLDAPAQNEQASEILRSPSIVVSSQALCEMVWVLRRLYRLDRADLTAAVISIVDATNVVVDRPVVEAGLAVMEGGGDFADGVIAFEGRKLGGDVFATFDKKAAAILEKTGQAVRLLGAD